MKKFLHWENDIIMITHDLNDIKLYQLTSNLVINHIFDINPDKIEIEGVDIKNLNITDAKISYANFNEYHIVLELDNTLLVAYKNRYCFNKRFLIFGTYRY